MAYSPPAPQLPADAHDTAPPLTALRAAFKIMPCTFRIMYVALLSIHGGPAAVGCFRTRRRCNRWPTGTTRRTAGQKRRTWERASPGLPTWSRSSAQPPPRWIPPPPPTVPTAVHEVADGHDTALRLPSPGIVCTAQVVPFHRSASSPPTAVHASGDVHDTAFSWLPFGSGIAWTVHVVPFHRSANGTPPVVLHVVVPDGGAGARRARYAGKVRPKGPGRHGDLLDGPARAVPVLGHRQILVGLGRARRKPRRRCSWWAMHTRRHWAGHLTSPPGRGRAGWSSSYRPSARPAAPGRRRFRRRCSRWPTGTTPLGAWPAGGGWGWAGRSSSYRPNARPARPGCRPPC